MLKIPAIMIPYEFSDKPVRLKVLVVDDNEESAKTMGWAIEAMDHEVRLEFNGQNAIETAKEFQPHVVLLDLGMPGMNGFEICQVMRQSPELAKTLFVAQTGWDPDQNKTSSREAGFDHYLTKPIDMVKLQMLLTAMTATRLTH